MYSWDGMKERGAPVVANAVEDDPGDVLVGPAVERAAGARGQVGRDEAPKRRRVQRDVALEALTVTVHAPTGDREPTARRERVRSFRDGDLDVPRADTSGSRARSSAR